MLGRRADASWRRLGARGVSGAGQNVRPLAGFALIEAVAAMAIVGITLVAVLGAVTADLSARRRALEVRRAVAVAGQVLDGLVLDTVGARSGSGPWERGAGPLGAYRWSIVKTEASGVPGLVDVTVHIRGPAGAMTVSTREFRRPQRTWASSDTSPP